MALFVLASVILSVGAVVVQPTGAAHAAYGVMIQPASGNVTYVVGGCSYDPRPDHTGADIAGQGGTPVVAAYGGTVTSSAYSSGYGNFVVISHGNGYTTLYGHMRNGVLVSVGDTVVQGQQLGLVGNTGNSYGDHLHFELKRNGTNITNNGYACGQSVTRGQPIPMDFPGLTPASGASFDYNSDGYDDILAVRNDGILMLYKGNGAVAFTVQQIGGGWGSMLHVVHGDFNGDGNGDIVAADAAGTLWFYAGNGAGAFTQTSVGNGWQTLSLVTGGVDYNGDGKPDLLGRKADNSLWLYKGNGAGGFPLSQQVGNGWGTMTSIVAGDFNGDGAGDIEAVESTGALWFYPGNGAGGWGARQSKGAGWTTNDVVTGGADYNGDGLADIVARRVSDNGLLIYRGDGVGGFLANTLIGTGWGVYTKII